MKQKLRLEPQNDIPKTLRCYILHKEMLETGQEFVLSLSS